MAKKEPLYPHVPKSRKTNEDEPSTGEQVGAADRAITLAKWLIRRRETAADTEIKEYEKMAIDLEIAGLPTLANKARETGQKEQEVVKNLTNIAKEIRHTFPGLR